MQKRSVRSAPDSRRRPRLRILALAVTAALLTSCGLMGEPGNDDVTVDVWLMRDSAPKELIDGLVRDFEKRNPGHRARVTVQDWDGIGEKVERALESDHAPDVIEAGNTQAAQYIDTGRVKDLTLKTFDPGGEDWVPGLAEAGKVGGSRYGIPYYAANRVVIYRKDLFRQAGVTDLPKTRKQWTDASRELDALPGKQGIYLPGQNWFVLAGFIWDEGGELATEESGQWTGTLDTPAALRGMSFYERLQGFGDGPEDKDEAEPDQMREFAEGNIAQLVDTPGAAQVVTEAAPELRGKLGFFPVPGKTAAKPGAVFTGGSVLIIPEHAAQQEAGYSFIELLTGKRWQKRLARTMSYVPNTAGLYGAVAQDPGAAAMAKGARNGRSAPNAPEWGAVEADNPMKAYQTAVLQGADPKAAARRASDELTELLSGNRT